MRVAIESYMVMNNQEIVFKSLGEMITHLRKEQGLTQTQLGRMVGLSQQIIADYEAGHRHHIALCRIIDIANALGVKPEELIKNGKGSEKKRGPAPKIQQLVERVQKLPKARQRFVMEMLEDTLARAS